MRTAFLSIVCGLLAVTSGAAVTNRVKLAVAVPASAVVRNVSVASNAVPAATTVAPVAPVPLAEKVQVLLAAIGPLDSAALVEAFVSAIGSAQEADIAAALAAVYNRTTPAEFVSIVTEVFNAVCESERAKLFAAVRKRTTPAEFFTILTDVISGAPPAKRLAVIVTAIGVCKDSESVRSLLPVISSIDTEDSDIVLIVEAMEALAKAVRADVPQSVAKVVQEAKRIETPEWYDIRLYDGGTGLWAVATKAKWYAERGDRKKVDELYRFFLRLMAEVESAK